MPDETYVLISDEDFEALEAAEKYLLVVIGLCEGTTTAPHLAGVIAALNSINDELCQALTADADKDLQLEHALEVEFRDSDPGATEPT